MPLPRPDPADASGGGRPGRNFWRLWTATAITNLGDGVSIIAYPWLASALTRDPVAIAGVAVASRLPWLLVTLPAGVVTDRVDRRRLMVTMDVLRGLLTAIVAIGVAVGESGLPDPLALADGSAAAPRHATVGLAALYLASLLLGAAEVLRDNAAQTLLPSLVPADRLEAANGRLAGIELVMNSFAGPPLAGALLAVAFWPAFALDAVSFGAAAAILATVRGSFRPQRSSTAAPPGRIDWRAEIGEGWRYLRGHPVLRSLAVALAVVNGVGALSNAALVLYVQEVLDAGAGGFAFLTFAGAVGGVVASVVGHRVSRWLGPGPSLFSTIIVSSAGVTVIALVSHLAVAAAAYAAIAFVGIVWNMITVGLRQAIIPDHLLGRVNSVYRLFGWGAIPVGTLLGGLLVAVLDGVTSREAALRWPFGIAGVLFALLLFYAVPRLRSEVLDRARQEARPTS